MRGNIHGPSCVKIDCPPPVNFARFGIWSRSRPPLTRPLSRRRSRLGWGLKNFIPFIFVKVAWILRFYLWKFSKFENTIKNKVKSLLCFCNCFSPEKQSNDPARNKTNNKFPAILTSTPHWRRGTFFWYKKKFAPHWLGTKLPRHQISWRQIVSYVIIAFNYFMIFKF